MAKIVALEFTQYIAPDGLVYQFDSTDRFLMSETGTGMPSIEYLTQRGPLQHGETVIDFRLNTRVIQLQMRQDSDGRSQYWDKRALLLNSIRPNRFVGSNFAPGVLRKIFQDGTIRDIHALIQEGPGFSVKQAGKWDEWGFTETLQFICHDPIYFNPIPKSVSFTGLADPTGEGWVLPFSFPIVFGATSYITSKTIHYPGTWLSYPTITITGPMDGPTLTNTSTDEKISLNYNIASGEILTISLEPGNKLVSSTLSSNLIGVVTSDSDLSTFHVAPEPEVINGNNTFTLDGSGVDTNSSLVITYYEKYIGI